ncbi:hypothetical protein ACFQ3Z_00490 [Streptomyces nogalater]
MITDLHDQPSYTTTALASHQPEAGRIAVHPTPLATAPAYLAHDLIRALGKHLPPPGIDPPWWTTNAESSWRVTAAWTQALHINHYVICRAHRITGRHLEHLMALRERTRARLTLVVSGPPPAVLTSILNAVPHHSITTLEAARQHLNTGSESLTNTSATYPWWHRAPSLPPTTNPGMRFPRAPGTPPGDPTPPPPVPMALRSGTPPPTRWRPPSLCQHSPTRPPPARTTSP